MIFSTKDISKVVFANKRVLFVMLVVSLAIGIVFYINTRSESLTANEADTVYQSDKGQSNNSFGNDITHSKTLNLAESKQVTTSYTQWKDMIAALGIEQLEDGELEGWHQFLLDPDLPAGLNENQYRFLVNQLLNRLRRIDDIESLVLVLADVYRNPGQDLLVRDYAIQHMGLSMGTLIGQQQLQSPGSPQSAVNGEWLEMKNEVEEVLWAAVEETNTSISGTALLALENMVQRVDFWDEPEKARARLARVAIDIANNEQASVVARITALQVAAKGEQADRVLEAARTIAGSSQNHVLRASAISVLGMRGTAEDQKLLLELLNRGDSRLQVAVRSALEKMDQRKDV
ncbi:MAG: hypothetical protein AAF571_12620 [Verrucomicrobiota bacterium]